MYPLKILLLLLVFFMLPFGRKARVRKIYWHPGVELKVRNFKSKTSSAPYQAHTCSTIEYEWEVKPGRKILFSSKAVFYPDSSWYDRHYKKQKELLQHELYHFHIAEIYSRNLKLKFSRSLFTTPGLEQQIDSIVHLVDVKYAKAESDYDSITNHGKDLAKQKWYYHRVDSLLRVSEVWRDTVVQMHY